MSRWSKWRIRRILRSQYLRCKRREAQLIRWNCSQLASQVRKDSEYLRVEIERWL